MEQVAVKPNTPSLEESLRNNNLNIFATTLMAGYIKLRLAYSNGIENERYSIGDIEEEYRKLLRVEGLQFSNTVSIADGVKNPDQFAADLKAAEQKHHWFKTALYSITAQFHVYFALNNIEKETRNTSSIKDERLAELSNEAMAKVGELAEHLTHIFVHQPDLWESIKPLQTYELMEIPYQFSRMLNDFHILSGLRKVFKEKAVHFTCDFLQRVMGIHKRTVNALPSSL